jgi:hypothetical protein
MRTDSWMRWAHVVAAAVLIGMMAGCGGVGTRPAPEHGAPSGHAHKVPDSRRQVQLSPAERVAVLAEMRLMLGSVSAVLHGLAANDRGAIEKAARASGMAMAADPRLAQKVPRPFLELGMATHQKFDRLADAVKAGAPGDEVVRSLADVTTGCVACHAMYRF